VRTEATGLGQTNPERASGALSNTRAVAISVAGAICAIGMCVGALGPWARTPVISFSGWAGIGLPLVVLAFIALAIQILHAFLPRRTWQVICLLLGGLSLVCAIVLAILEAVLSHAGSLLAFLIARGAHKDLIASHPVSLGWGIPVLAAASFLLMIVSIVGLFGRFPEPAFSRLRSRRQLQPTEPDVPPMPGSEPDPFDY
jgi:hypothetical protein